ncbi:hypothetical protein FNV43_RR12585 [Rhamnella rubrinervis]|uniref:proline--tRNA ligase n=1 Tax=Rhamnella rubrinervis TaxID=2594499 RepID=A0A8K0H854_9ROSA|nr:hypothetical protein FNV43_RR12585 [Rhamnella rubrinervis]
MAGGETTNAGGEKNKTGGQTKKANANAGGGGKKEEVKKETGLGLSNRKDENFGDWYSEVVVNGEMIEYCDISGCYILRPWTMSIWEIMQKDRIEGFAPEVAWVNKSGESDWEVPIAIRPTSETVMYPYYSKLISGHRDLPLKLNQWGNVVRWEFSNPTPFIRSREFLWQEGHTAFATKAEADAKVLEILELYKRIYEEYLTIPVIKGKKSELEKFAGGLYTTSVEAFIPNTGRGIQGATSHCLGQNFAKMFEINFENEKGGKAMVWQNSWAYSTRTIGVMVMVHGDDKGLVLPPKVASVQVIVVPVPYKDADTQGIFDACTTTVNTLNEAGIRAEADFRDNYSPGWKYSHWEMKGVPLRIEIGPKDLVNSQVCVVRRDNSAKIDIPMVNLVVQVKDLLVTIQQNLYDVAKQKRDACVQIVRTWDEFIKALSQRKLILAPWCDEEEVEKDVKARTKGEMGACKTLCSPFDQPELPEGTLCFASGKPATKWSYWGRSCFSLRNGAVRKLIGFGSELSSSIRNSVIKELRSFEVILILELMEAKFFRFLKIVGVGYKARAEAEGRLLYLKLGYSHEVELTVPPAVRAFCFKNNVICCTGIDKQRVHQFAAAVRSCKPPEVYKGKGIMYLDEVIKKKQGKKSK